jgi:hypothetical protein
MAGSTSSSSSSYAVLEFHGFRDGNNELIVKELALAGSRGDYLIVFFESPYDKSCLDSRTLKSVNWLEKHFHHISWDYGDVKYSEEVMTTLCNHYSTIYTKGLEKANFLRRFHSNVKLISDTVPKPSIEEEEEEGKTRCPLHMSGAAHCALKSALFYMKWLQKHMD